MSDEPNASIIANPSDHPPNSGNPVLEKLAIALSGGGAKGDFEVGAVRCLYNMGIRPSVLTGTSVGSVNALKLAEGEEGSFEGSAPQGHVRGLAGLEDIWLGLKTDPDMWTLEPGVQSIFDTLSNLPSQASAISDQAGSVASASVGGIILSILGIPGFASFAPQLSDLNNLQDSASETLAQLTTTLQGAENVEGFANYDPLESLMRRPASLYLPCVQGSGVALRLAMVALEDGALRYVTESNVMIERDGAKTPVPPPPTSAEIDALQAQAAKLKDEIGLWQNDAGSPASPNLGPVQKPRAGLANLVQQLAQIEARIAAASVNYDLIRAAIASSSLPVICRPTIMQDGRSYVDGGIRTLAPIEAAIDAGASMVYAIAAGSTKFDAQTLAQITGTTPLPLLGIALRVGEQILPDEIARRDLYPDNPWPVPVVVIQPDPNVDDIHDGLTIEPGLIRIRMAYGFMRAFDTLQAYKTSGGASGYVAATAQNSQAGNTDAIVALRKKIWSLEFPANGKKFVLPTSALPPKPYSVENLPAPDASAHAQVKALKGQLATLVAARIAHYSVGGANGADSLPAGYGDWSTSWEAHSWTPTIAL